MAVEAKIDYLALIERGEFVHRMITGGVAYRDIRELETTLKSSDDWHPFWSDKGRIYEKSGDEARDKNFKLNAGACYLQAALAWHYAGCLHFHSLTERFQAQDEKVRLFRQAARYFVPPARPVEIPFEGIRLPGYLRLPSGAVSSPCVILLSGSDSTKEEFHTLEDLFLSAGIATLSIDGPGQGEAWVNMKLRPDFEKAVSAAVDFLEKEAGIDDARIGVLGKSFGGHLAVRASVFDDRIQCAVWLGGFYDTRHYNWDEPLRRLRFQVFCGTDNLERAKAMAAKFDLSDVAPKMRRPLLVVHSRLERTSPPEHAERLAREAGGETTLAMYEEGFHCCPNLAPTVYPMMVDWAVQHL